MAVSKRSSMTMRIDMPLAEEVQAHAAKDVGPLSAELDALSHSEELGSGDLNEMFQSVYDAGFLTSMDGLILVDNVRAGEFFDYDEGELRGRPIGDVVAGMNRSVLETISRNLEQRRQFTLVQGTCVRRDGTRFPAEVSTTCLNLAHTTCLCFFIRNITNRVEREERLKQAVQKLEEHDRARTEFISNVSHEFRTPLTSIKYITANMLRGIAGEMGPQARKYLQMIGEDCDRLAHTVEDILDMSRMDSNRLKFHRVTGPFGRLVQNTVASLRVHAEVAGLTLQVEAPDDAGFVYGDMKKLERVILNIVKNAIKFTPSGGVNVALGQIPEYEGFLILQVVDTGMGIPPEHIARVTERYYRVGEFVSGTGLGLAITKELVERHGGQLVIESPPPGEAQGTQVSVMLPVVPPPHVTIVSPAAAVVDALVADAGRNGYRVDAGSPESWPDAGAMIPDLLCIDCTAPGMAMAPTLFRLLQDGRLTNVPRFAMVEEQPDAGKLELLKGLSIPVLRCPWEVSKMLDVLQELTHREDNDSDGGT